MLIICLLIIASVFAGDFYIKAKIEKSKKLPRTLCKGRLFIQKYHNRGAMLNLGEKRPGLIAAVSVLLTVFALVLFVLSFGSRGNNLLRVGLAFLLGGAFGNTYDRLRRKYVVDYVSFPGKGKRFSRIVFNISDFAIIAGALLSCLGQSR